MDTALSFLTRGLELFCPLLNAFLLGGCFQRPSEKACTGRFVFLQLKTQSRQGTNTNWEGWIFSSKFNCGYTWVSLIIKSKQIVHQHIAYVTAQLIPLTWEECPRVRSCIIGEKPVLRKNLSLRHSHTTSNVRTARISKGIWRIIHSESTCSDYGVCGWN